MRIPKVRLNNENATTNMVEVPKSDCPSLRPGKIQTRCVETRSYTQSRFRRIGPKSGNYWAKQPVVQEMLQEHIAKVEKDISQRHEASGVIGRAVRAWLERNRISVPESGAVALHIPLKREHEPYLSMYRNIPRFSLPIDPDANICSIPASVECDFITAFRVAVSDDGRKEIVDIRPHDVAGILRFIESRTADMWREKAPAIRRAVRNLDGAAFVGMFDDMIHSGLLREMPLDVLAESRLVSGRIPARLLELVEQILTYPYEMRYNAGGSPTAHTDCSCLFEFFRRMIRIQLSDKDYISVRITHQLLCTVENSVRVLRDTQHDRARHRMLCLLALHATAYGECNDTKSPVQPRCPLGTHLLRARALEGLCGLCEGGSVGWREARFLIMAAVLDSSPIVRGHAQALFRADPARIVDSLKGMDSVCERISGMPIFKIRNEFVWGLGGAAAVLLERVSELDRELAVYALMLVMGSVDDLHATTGAQLSRATRRKLHAALRARIGGRDQAVRILLRQGYLARRSVALALLQEIGAFEATDAPRILAAAPVMRAALGDAFVRCEVLPRLPAGIGDPVRGALGADLDREAAVRAEEKERRDRVAENERKDAPNPKRSGREAEREHRVVGPAARGPSHRARKSGALARSVSSRDPAHDVHVSDTQRRIRRARFERMQCEAHESAVARRAAGREARAAARKSATAKDIAAIVHTVPDAPTLDEFVRDAVAGRAAAVRLP